MNQNSQNSVGKYKTMLCKHYDSTNGCMYKDKCQFAHGLNELRSSGGFVNNTYNVQPKIINQNQDMNQKKTPNPTNFKIVKCKNFDKDGVCKYGNNCTFAHGDTEVRSKVENTIMLGNPTNMLPPNQMIPPFQNYFDPNLFAYMQQMSIPFNTDFSQMQMMNSQTPIDMNNFNLNSTGGNVPFNGDFGNQFNMGVYNDMYGGMYPNNNIQNNMKN